jgi:hypothetical protein
MSASDFLLVSNWRLAAPRPDIWSVLKTPTEWPRWWRFVASVDELDHGDASGLGAKHRVSWTSRLPYRVNLETVVVETQAEQLIRLRAEGDVQGEGCWRLRDAEGGGCSAEYTWRVAVDKPWMRALAPLLRPVFAWNHNAVMDEGERGLKRYLETRK